MLDINTGAGKGYCSNQVVLIVAMLDINLYTKIIKWMLLYSINCSYVRYKPKSLPVGLEQKL